MEEKNINQQKTQTNEDRNIEYLEKIIQKYEFLHTLQKSIEKVKNEPELKKINDLLRLVCSFLEDKIEHMNNELKILNEKLKAISEEFSTEEFERIKQEKEKIETELKNQLQEQETKYNSLLDRYQKLSDAYRELKTEYENFVNRTQKNFEKLKREAKEKIISNFIPVIDSFEISLKSIKNTQNIHEVVKGVELIYTQFLDVLINEGLEIIKSNAGEKFDPSINEAIEIEETTDPEKDSLIVQEYRPAYKLMDKLLRPSSVKVYKFINKSEGEQNV
ncbi:MAG: nucleotide exchange factor GrpE [bacterium]